MTTADVVNQIHGLRSFFASQGAMLSGETLTQSRVAMTSSIVRQIASLPSLDMTGASTINDAIVRSGLPDDQQGRLAHAVTQRLLSHTTSQQVPIRKCQLLTQPQMFFTASDWDVFEDSGLMTSQKVQ